VRPIIIHYHIFKNAGSSLDQTLRANFGKSWASMESSGPGVRVPRAEVLQYVRAHPTAAAISSHTIAMPVLEDPDLHVIAVTLLRHPMERARSIWEYNRRRVDDVPKGRLAKRLGLAEYLELGLEPNSAGDPSVGGHQTRWLSRDVPGSTPLDRARTALAGFAVVGVVEEYPESLQRLQRAAGPWFPELKLRVWRVNAKPDSVRDRLLQRIGREESLQDRLRALRRRIGHDLYGRLERANRDDLILWEEAMATFQTGS
jgi:hypothetical protein